MELVAHNSYMVHNLLYQDSSYFAWPKLHVRGITPALLSSWFTPPQDSAELRASRSLLKKLPYRFIIFKGTPAQVTLGENLANLEVLADYSLPGQHALTCFKQRH